MLGRLKMSIEECIDAYLQISKEVFQPKRSWLNWPAKVKDILNLGEQFDSKKLEAKIKDIVKKSGESVDAMLKIEDNPKCRV
jgi:hypothetical protein